MKRQFDSRVVYGYHKDVIADELHRYKSWEHCYEAFQSAINKDYLSLHLAFYLASWGMYRGSSGLLQKNNRIHLGAIDILARYKHIQCNAINDVTKNSISEILKVKDELEDYYSRIEYARQSKEKPISATDTLISKILLGTLACCPAYDRYYIAGLKEVGLKKKTFDNQSLHELFDFIDTNKNQIKNCQQSINVGRGTYYPLMKVMDMHFWQIGYDTERNKSSDVSGSLGTQRL